MCTREGTQEWARAGANAPEAGAQESRNWWNVRCLLVLYGWHALWLEHPAGDAVLQSGLVLTDVDVHGAAEAGIHGVGYHRAEAGVAANLLVESDGDFRPAAVDGEQVTADGNMAPRLEDDAAGAGAAGNEAEADALERYRPLGNWRWR